MYFTISLFFVLIFMATYSICKAESDKIKDYRTHLAAHPYGDYWHLCEHGITLSAIMIGMNLMYEFMWIFRYYGYFRLLAIVSCIALVFIYFIAAVVLKIFIWGPVYMTDPAKAVYTDETWQMPSFGKWIDKFLGFHW